MSLQPWKYSFSMRITNIWNSLPFSVVTAPSVNSFKNRLDKHWALQELKYDWETELSGTGSRSRLEFWVLRVPVPDNSASQSYLTIWAEKQFAYIHNIHYVILCYIWNPLKIVLQKLDILIRSYYYSVICLLIHLITSISTCHCHLISN